jgi:hypothetical protein
MNFTPTPPTHSTWDSAPVSLQQSDIIPVPRAVLVRLLTHVVAGNKRFPTRHLTQAAQMLQRILGINC